MKTKHKKYTQTMFAKAIGIEQPEANKLLKGALEVSYPLSFKLAKLFPKKKDVFGWKAATKEDIQKLFDQLKNEYKAKKAV